VPFKPGTDGRDGLTHGALYSLVANTRAEIRRLAAASGEDIASPRIGVVLPNGPEVRCIVGNTPHRSGHSVLSLSSVRTAGEPL
jgi:hypothetical protein